MNERIRELVEQAGPLQDVLCKITEQTNAASARYLQSKALLDFQLEKFAKLIALECMVMCDKAVEENLKTYDEFIKNKEFELAMISKGAAVQAEKLSKHLKQHFGIEK